MQSVRQVALGASLLPAPSSHSSPGSGTPSPQGQNQPRDKKPDKKPGDASQGEAQHMGLGSTLIDQAKQIARDAGYGRIAVISAIGTREYYARHGFAPDGLYMTCELPAAP